LWLGESRVEEAVAGGRWGSQGARATDHRWWMREEGDGEGGVLVGKRAVEQSAVARWKTGRMFSKCMTRCTIPTPFVYNIVHSRNFKTN
jgi:hypothetical protein